MQLTISKIYPDHAVGHPPARHSVADSSRTFIRKMEKKRVEGINHVLKKKHRESIQGGDWLL